jgi:hypothetical protein
MEIRKSSLLPAESPTAASGLAERGARTPAQVVGGGDRSSIKALDLSAALQILLAEVKLALSEDGFVSLASDASLRPPAPLSSTVAAPALVELFLQLVPQDEATSPEVLSTTIARLVQAISRGSSAAIERVVAWRDTPPAIAATLQEVRSLALAVISGGQPALLSRPEWLGLGTSLQRLRRRRRTLLVTDTDADHLEVPSPPGGRR